MVAPAPSPEAYAVRTGQARERRQPLAHDLVLAYGLAWAAGAIHLVAATEHLGEHVTYAVFFTVLGCFQLWWGIAIGRSPTRRLLLAGGIVSLAVVALWIVSRTNGIPIGPGSGGPEPVGALDSVASADELLLALLVGLRLRFSSFGSASKWLHAVGVILILLSAVSLTQLSHAH